MENTMIKHYGILFNNKSGKIINSLETECGYALMSFYALNNTTKTRDFVIFNENGIIVEYYEGRGNGECPKKWKEIEGKHIDNLCKGLFEAIVNG